MTHRFQAVKGTRDILPPESALWNRVEQTARRVFATYNFQEIRLLPQKEYTGSLKWSSLLAVNSD